MAAIGIVMCTVASRIACLIVREAVVDILHCHTQECLSGYLVGAAQLERKRRVSCLILSTEQLIELIFSESTSCSEQLFALAHAEVSTFSQHYLIQIELTLNDYISQTVENQINKFGRKYNLIRLWAQCRNSKTHRPRALLGLCFCALSRSFALSLAPQTRSFAALALSVATLALSVVNFAVGRHLRCRTRTCCQARKTVSESIALIFECRRLQLQGLPFYPFRFELACEAAAL
eukprot:IDg6714t1